jgi:hypothetical protein
VPVGLAVGNHAIRLRPQASVVSGFDSAIYSPSLRHEDVRWRLAASSGHLAVPTDRAIKRRASYAQAKQPPMDADERRSVAFFVSASICVHRRFHDVVPFLASWR